jgi:ABC-type transporter Mla subunit MlaD
MTTPHASNTTTGTPDPSPVALLTIAEATARALYEQCATHRLTIESQQATITVLDEQVVQFRALLVNLESIVGQCKTHGAGCQSWIVELVRALRDREDKLRQALHAVLETP